MWRSMFLGLGAYCCLVGAECLVIDKAVLAGGQEVATGLLQRLDSGQMGQREIVPADWAPWSLLSAGAVTMLYSFTLPQRAVKKP